MGSGPGTNHYLPHTRRETQAGGLQGSAISRNDLGPSAALRPKCEYHTWRAMGTLAGTYYAVSTSLVRDYLSI